MKKILFYMPFFVAVIFYGAVAFLGGLAVSPVVILWIVLLGISGFVLSRAHFWGALIGALPAVHLIYMGTQDTGQIVKETPIGIMLLIFYIICGIMVYLKYKK